jgi:hypothetical protein
MTPRARKLVLTVHVVCSVGWLGSVVAYLALAITGLATHDAQTVRAAYFSLGILGWFVIVPASLAALLSGLVQALGTEWGLLRHYWIATKLALTVVGTAILLVHMRTAVSRMVGMEAEAVLSSALLPQRIQLVVHAAGGLLVLLTVTALSVFKPWGMTAYGRRKQQERRQASQPAQVRATELSPARAALGRSASWWAKAIGAHVFVLVVVVAVALHLSSGAMPRH